MLSIEQKVKICNKIIEKGQITSKELKEFGITNQTISNLVESGFLISKKIGVYIIRAIDLLNDIDSLNDIDLLYTYGLFFLEASKATKDKKNEYRDIAIKCFMKGHRIDSTNRNINLRLLLHFIINKNYDKAYAILACMYNTDDEAAIKENNLFLYLLSCYEACPLNLYAKISSNHPEDFALNDFDDETAMLVVSKIYYQQYEEARELIENTDAKTPEARSKKGILLVFLKRTILNVCFTDLQVALKSNKADDFIKLLPIYLSTIGREEYREFLLDLIKLCNLDDDHTYDIVLRELVEMEMPGYFIGVTGFISDFYKYVAEEKYEQALICLKVIEKYGNLSLEILEDLRKKVVLDRKKPIKDNKLTKERVNRDLVNRAKEMENDGTIVLVIPDVSEEYKDYASAILNDNNRDSRLANIKFWSCGDGDKGHTLVLRLIAPKAPRIDFWSYLKRINNSFNNKKYPECIELIEELLKNEAFNLGDLSSVRDLFYKLGHSYYHHGDKRPALKRKSTKNFILVTNINRLMPKEEQDDKYDFTDRIRALQAKKHWEQMRSGIVAAANIVPPREDIGWNSFFGTTTIDPEVAERLNTLQDILYTSIELEQALDECANEHGLTAEDVLLMRLIKARDYYIDNLYQEGDYEISLATLSSEKTPLIDTLAKQIFDHRFDYRRMTKKHSKKRVRIRNFEPDLPRPKFKIYSPSPQKRIRYF